MHPDVRHVEGGVRQDHDAQRRTVPKTYEGAIAAGPAVMHEQLTVAEPHDVPSKADADLAWYRFSVGLAGERHRRVEWCIQ